RHQPAGALPVVERHAGEGPDGGAGGRAGSGPRAPDAPRLGQAFARHEPAAGAGPGSGLKRHAAAGPAALLAAKSPPALARAAGTRLANSRAMAPLPQTRSRRWLNGESLRAVLAVIAVVAGVALLLHA